MSLRAMKERSRYIRKCELSFNLSQSTDINLHIYSRSGFVMEGSLRKANWADGKWEDIYEMGMLEEEWAAKLGEINLKRDSI